MLTDAELNAAILESGWTTRGPEAVKEFHALARSIEKRMVNKLSDPSLAWWFKASDANTWAVKVELDSALPPDGWYLKSNGVTGAG